jgi:hypothetical protein
LNFGEDGKNGMAMLDSEELGVTAFTFVIWERFGCSIEAAFTYMNNFVMAR